MIRIEIQDAGIRGWIIIDSLVNGQSCGGVRISDDITEEEIKILANAMTLKYKFAGYPSLGGAKAGIVLNEQDSRIDVLRRFGEIARPFLEKKIYIPWTDMNCTAEDINIIREAAGMKKTDLPDSAYTTALGVFATIKAVFDNKKLPLNGKTVAIEGFGKVGSYLAKELKKENVKIIAISTRNGAIYNDEGLDIKKLLELREIHSSNLIEYYEDADIISLPELLELNVDILIPCARIHSINTGNMKEVHAKMIIPAANVPITLDAERYLSAKGIIVLPYFVSNIGGILFAGLQRYLDDKAIKKLILSDFYSVVSYLLTANDSRRDVTLSDTATELINIKNKLNNKPIQNRLRSLLNHSIHKMNENGLFPSRIFGEIMLRSIRENLRQNMEILKEITA